jgi:hypothetical protein
LQWLTNKGVRTYVLKVSFEPGEPVTPISLTGYGDADFAAHPDYARACAAGNAAARRLAVMAPGPQLAAELAAVSAVLMDSASQVIVYAAWERQSGWTDAQKMASLARAAGSPPVGDEDRWLATDVALMTGLSERSIDTRIGQMRHVADGLPQAWSAWTDGRITSTHLWVLANVTRDVPAELARRVEDRVLEPAIVNRSTPGELADAARRVLIKLDPAGCAARSAAAKKRRSDVRLYPDEDEMATLSACTDAWTGRQLMDEVNRRADARKRAGDPRSLGQCRIAALTEAVFGDDISDDTNPADIPDDPAPAGCDTHQADDVVDGEDVADRDPVDSAMSEREATGDDATGDDTSNGDAAPGNPNRIREPGRPKRATALVLVPLSTLLGGSEPGQLDGYGPISAALARRIAASDVSFRRLVFDPVTGKPLDLSPHTYQLSPAQRRWIEVRDRTCRMRGCRRRAVYCDADHAKEFPAGLTTCDNCGIMCRRHHNYKTKKAWQLTRNDDDSVDWTSPLGFRWRTPPATYEEFIEQPDIDVEPVHVDDDNTVDDPEIGD